MHNTTGVHAPFTGIAKNALSIANVHIRSTTGKSGSVESRDERAVASVVLDVANYAHSFLRVMRISSPRRMPPKKKRPAKPAVVRLVAPPDTPRPKSAKRATNLTLDTAAVERGERYGKQQGASLSQLVTDFLYALPDADGPHTVVRESLSPIVRRLHGIAARESNDDGSDRDRYRARLRAKYGSE